jgi:RNA polymerase sigma-70 factor (ECF subfamily)
MTEITVHAFPGTQSLVLLAASGDEAAFARLIAAHSGAMTRVAYVIASDWDTAGEAVQTAWTIAWGKLRSLRDEDRIEPWLVAIAANETRKLLAHQRRRSVVEISAVPDSSHSTDPADHIDLVDLGRALRRLGPDDRGLIAMRYVAGFDSSQIGAVTGMSASGVRTRLARLLERLRMDLDDA